MLAKIPMNIIKFFVEYFVWKITICDQKSSTKNKNIQFLKNQALTDSNGYQNQIPHALKHKYTKFYQKQSYDNVTINKNVANLTRFNLF